MRVKRGRILNLLSKLGLFIRPNPRAVTVVRALTQEEVYLAIYEMYLDGVESLPRLLEEVDNKK